MMCKDRNHLGLYLILIKSGKPNKYTYSIAFNRHDARGSPYNLIKFNIRVLVYKIVLLIEITVINN